MKRLTKYHSKVLTKALIQHLEAEKNCRHLTGDIFKCIFLNEHAGISLKISLKLVPNGSNQQYSSIGSDNGLAPTRRQAIICTNDG